MDNYRDLGVSAFRSKNADKGALKAFLDRVESGVIEPGSYLIVESLDRLSRTDITYALQMFLGLINAGIVVVTLADDRVYDRNRINDGNFTDIIISLTILSRANEESRMKSQRISQSWSAKRSRISEEKMTAMCPSWLKLTADRKKFELVPDKAKIVRSIFEMASEGKGKGFIARKFNTENVPVMGDGVRWHVSTIQKIMESRAVIGEYQPGKMVNGKRTLLDPVPGYFPPVISMDMYSTVQRIRRARKSYRGRGEGNPIAGLAYNVMTGNKMLRLAKNVSQGWVYLVDVAAPTGGAPYISWKFDDFLKSLLLVCEAVTTCPPPAKKENHELEAALKRKDEIESQIPRLVEFIATGFSASVEEKLRGLETEKAEVERLISGMQIDDSAPNLDLRHIDWRDTTKFKENARAIIERIDVHPKDRWFTVKTFDGREARYTEDGDAIDVVSSEGSPNAPKKSVTDSATRQGSKPAPPARRSSSKRRG